jgi:hypothetical protein
MSARIQKRHPAEVTSDRIADHIYRWHNRLTGAERDALSRARDILENLADETWGVPEQGSGR